jgi:hypothetical protein
VHPLATIASNLLQQKLVLFLKKGRWKPTLEHEEHEEGEIIADLCGIADVVEEAKVVV